MSTASFRAVRSALLVVLAFALPSRASAADSKRIAVLEFHNFATLSTYEMQAITDFVRGEALKAPSPPYFVMTRENILEVLPPGSDLAACEGECEVDTGRKVGADYVVSGEVGRFGKKLQVNMKMYDTKSAALLSQETAKAEDIDGLGDNVPKASARLFGKLPGMQRAEDGPRFGEGKIGDNPGKWNMPAPQEALIVEFNSDPAGAVLMLDGSMLCQQTPCSKVVAPGPHEMRMNKEKYVERRETVEVSATVKKVNWQLQPDFGWLSVNSTPSGMPVLINNRVTGHTPIQRLELPTGDYEVKVSDTRYYGTGERAIIRRGEEKILALTPAPRVGGFHLTAKSSRGDDVTAQVFVDGQKAGDAPAQFMTFVGQHSLEVQCGNHGKWTGTIDIAERTVQEVSAVCKGGDLTEPEAGQLARQFYDTKGEWAGQYVVNVIQKSRIERIGETQSNYHMKYQYRCVKDKCSGGQSVGDDWRVFHFRLVNDAWQVEKMDGYQSAKL